MKRFTKIIILVITLYSSYLNAEEVFSVEILNFGLYSTELVRNEKSSSSTTGEISSSKNLKHLSKTVNIPAIKGYEFGIEFIIKSKHEIYSTPLEYIWTPSSPITLKSGEIFKKTQYQLTKKIGKKIYAGYILSIESELAPKHWELQIYSGSTLLLKKTFYLNHSKEIKINSLPVKARKATSTIKSENTRDRCLNILRNVTGVTKIEHSIKTSKHSNIEQTYDVKTEYEGIGLLIEYRFMKNLHLYAYDNRPLKVNNTSRFSAGSKVKFNLLDTAANCFKD